MGRLAILLPGFVPMGLVLLALAVGGCGLGDPPGAREGRAGNDHLRAERADEAVAAYTAGLDRSPPPRVRFSLLDHRGMAHALAGRDAEAVASFQDALRAAPDDRAAARAAYHAGNAAAASGDRMAALAFYRRALLAEPDHEAARHNFERLALDDTEPPPEQSPDDAPPPEPSAFARDLKARADALVAERRYAPALALFLDGLRTDSTVAAYQSTIDRLEGVVGVEEGTR